MLKKTAIVVVGVLAVLLLAVVATPMLIDWNRFKPDIAAAVRDATGRELRIDGDLELSFLPTITFSARDLHLTNPQGFATPDLATVAAIEGEVPLWPLLQLKVVVERLVIEGAEVALEVTETGAANWMFEPAPDSDPANAADDLDLPINDLRLDDVRLNGGFTYRNALNGQDLVGRDLELALALARIDAQLDLTGRMVLNDEPVELMGSIDPFDAAFTGTAGHVALSLTTTHLDAVIDGDLAVRPTPGVDGRIVVDVASAGALMAWIDLPLATNPGPLKLTAVFASDGPRIALERLTLVGDYLDARATLSIDTSGDSTQIVANIESGMLDIDRYLPPAVTDDAAAGAAASTQAPPSRLQAIPETPLDLAPLRQLGADIDVIIEGIRIGGQEFGPIKFQANAADGVIDADLIEFGLSDGTIVGRIHAEAGADDRLSASAVLDLVKIGIGPLVAPASDQPPVKAEFNGYLEASTVGGTPRELAAATVGALSAYMRVEDDAIAAGDLTGVVLTLVRPTLDARPQLAGHVTYNGQPVMFDITTDPMDVLLALEPVTVDATIESELLTASYDGRVIQVPVPSLDGTFAANVPAVGRLMNWLGRPWPEDQPDPGAIAAHAVFQSDGTQGQIESASIEGEGLKLEATGSFDARSPVTQVELALTGGVLDLDRYVPLGAAATAADATSAPETDAAATDPIAALSDAPLDLTLLRELGGTFELSLDGIDFADIQLRKIGLSAALASGVLEVQLNRLAVVEGTVGGRLKADASGDTLGLELNASVNAARMRDLEAIFQEAGVSAIGVGSADIALTTRGKSPRSLVTGATGTFNLSLPGVSLADGPIASMAEIATKIDLPGVDANPKINVTANLTPRADETESLPFELDGQLGPLGTLLAGEEAPLQLTVNVGSVEVGLDGRIAGLDATPQPDLTISVTGQQLSDLSLLTGTELPEVGPMSFSASVTSENQTYKIADLAATLGSSDLSGEASIALGGDRPYLTADLQSNRLDVSELASEETEPASDVPADDPTVTGRPTSAEQAERDGTTEAATPPDEPAPPATAQTYLFPDDPLPLDVLRGFDADVGITIAELTTLTRAKVTGVDAGIKLADGRLDVSPLNGSVSGGGFEIELILDAGQTPATVDLKLVEADMIAGTFLDLFTEADDGPGKVDGNLKLTGVGDSPRALASSLNGRVNIVIEGGAIESQVMRYLAIGLGDVLRPVTGSRPNNNLNCLVASFDFVDGVGTSSALIVDFPSVALSGVGSINLGDETMDLNFAVDSKNSPVMALALPFNLRGPLAAPSVSADVIGSAREAALAAGLWFIPPVAIGAILAREAGSMLRENACVAAIRQAVQQEEGGTGKPTGSSGILNDLTSGIRGLLGGNEAQAEPTR